MSDSLVPLQLQYYFEYAVFVMICTDMIVSRGIIAGEWKSECLDGPVGIMALGLDREIRTGLRGN